MNTAPMSASRSDDHGRARLLVKIARMYHEQGLRQPEIASRLSLSQARVSRLLKEGHDVGIIRTEVVAPPGIHAGLEQDVMERYGLRDVVVVDVEGTSGEVVAGVGSGAATYLDTIVMSEELIGVSSWSATLLNTVDRMRPRLSPVAHQVVQAMGGVGSPEAQIQATRLTGRLADLTGAAPVFVPSPGLVGSPALRAALMDDPGVRVVQDVWADLTLTLLGIGTLQPSPLLRMSGNSLSEDEQRELDAAGAVGDVCLRYFDRTGRPVETGFDQRIIGIDRPTMLAVPRRIGVAGGLDKLEAIRAAVLGGWVNILITDIGVASELARE